MIREGQAMSLLLEACPSFRPRREEWRADPVFEEGLLHVELGEFAHHLVGLLKSGSTDEFAAVFAVIERLQLEGAPYVQNAAIVGLLEGIQKRRGRFRSRTLFVRTLSANRITEAVVGAQRLLERRAGVAG